MLYDFQQFNNERWVTTRNLEIHQADGALEMY